MNDQCVRRYSFFLIPDDVPRVAVRAQAHHGQFLNTARRELRCSVLAFPPRRYAVKRDADVRNARGADVLMPQHHREPNVIPQHFYEVGF